MVRIALVGNVEPQTSAVLDLLTLTGHELEHVTRHGDVLWLQHWKPDLIVVAGWRRLIPPEILAVPRCGTVGFHSARLPQYPGRAPVPWALVRGDAFTENTMLYLDKGVDSGDIIDRRRIAIRPGDTPETIYPKMAATAVDMLLEHLPAILDGTAPRTPQDETKRGPLTTVSGWDVWHEMQRLGAGHV